MRDLTGPTQGRAIRDLLQSLLVAEMLREVGSETKKVSEALTIEYDESIDQRSVKAPPRTFRVVFLPSPDPFISKVLLSRG